MTEQGPIEQYLASSEPALRPGSTALFPARRRNDLCANPDQAMAAKIEFKELAQDKKKKKKKKILGSSRGIETIFRTAYRAQLDLTALAATKANIMISLNGLILSVLTLSGPFVLVAEPMFTAPIAVFLTTCLTSIIFAVLAAQPRFDKRRSKLKDFNDDSANILVFEQFSSLNMLEHTQVMTRMLGDNKRIYKNMTRQLYKLGIDADRKYRFLKLSYTAFLAGLTASTLMLLVVGMLFHTQDFSEIMTSLQSRTMPFQ
jgi:hypothetical protein